MLTFERIYRGFVSIESTLLPMARNKLVEQMYNKFPDFTHALFIDDDMADFSSDSLGRLLYYSINEDMPIVSAVCTTRNEEEIKIINHGVTMDNLLKKEIIETPHTGMAFTLVQRKVFDDIREETPSGPIWFNLDRVPRKSFQTEVEEFIRDKTSELEEDDKETRKNVLKEAISLGMSSYLNTPLVGEDVNFCKRARMYGHKTYVDCGCPISHIGDKSYNIRDAIEQR